MFVSCGYGTLGWCGCVGGSVIGSFGWLSCFRGSLSQPDRGGAPGSARTVPFGSVLGHEILWLVFPVQELLFVLCCSSWRRRFHGWGPERPSSGARSERQTER